MPAEGKSWEHAYSIPSAKLNSLPKRLMRELIEVSFDDSLVRIANRCYSGAEVIDATGTTGRSETPPDTSMGGMPGESGGTLAPQVGELPSDGKDVATETVSGSDSGSLPDKTDGTAKPEPDGTRVPAEGVNNKALVATAKMVRASNNTKMPDSMMQYLTNYANAVKKRKHMQFMKAKAAESAAAQDMDDVDKALLAGLLAGLMAELAPEREADAKPPAKPPLGKLIVRDIASGKETVIPEKVPATPKPPRSANGQKIEKLSGKAGDRSKQATMEEMKDLGFLSGLGVNNKAIVAIVKMVRAYIADGVVKFADFVVGFAEDTSPATARKLSEYLEAAWEISAETNSDLDPVGKVADVLGPEKEVTDDGQNDHGKPIEVKLHQTRAWAECLSNLEEHWPRKLESYLQTGTLKTYLDQTASLYMKELTALAEKNPTLPESTLKELTAERTLEQNLNPDENPLSEEAETMLMAFREKWQPRT